MRPFANLDESGSFVQRDPKIIALFQVTLTIQAGEWRMRIEKRRWAKKLRSTTEAFDNKKKL